MTIKEQIKNYLKNKGVIDNIKAWALFNTFSLKQIIHELRQERMDIRDYWSKSKEGKRFKKYFLAAPGVRRVF
jgi:hypothetical protein